MRPVGGPSASFYPCTEVADSAPTAVPQESTPNPGPAGPPSLGEIRRYPAGRYAHLSETLLKMQLADSGQDDKSRKSHGAEAQSSKLDNPQRASSSRSRGTAKQPSCMATNLAELAKWSENQRPYTLDPIAVSGLGKAFPAAAVASILASGKADLKKRLAAQGIALSEAVVVERRSHIDINLNYLELGYYLKRDKGMWLAMDKNRVGDTLCEKAHEYFAAKAEQGVTALAALQSLSSKNSIGVMLELLKDLPGLVIGEVHHGVSSKRELIKNMSALKAGGVSTVFFEHLCADAHGKALHEYMNSPLGSPMPPRLKAYLDLLSDGNLAPDEVAAPYNFTTLLEAAKKAQLKVIPLDTVETYATSKLQDNARIKVMNYYAAEKIRLTQPEGKWIAFVGSAHATTYEGIPGLAELQGVRSLIIDDLGSSSKAQIKINVKGYGEKINPDVSLSFKL